jgi:hypothetical protein
MKTDYPKATKPQADDRVELAENDPGPAIEILKKIHHVPRAAVLHPGLAFADKPWPSAAWGPVTIDVLEHLRRARAVFMAKGFKIEADPENPMGDGKSWVLIC